MSRTWSELLGEPESAPDTEEERSGFFSRLRESLAEECPSELRFAPGPIPSRGRNTDPAGSAVVPRAGPGELAQAQQLAAPIEDEELRALVARAAAASLARRAAK